MRRVGGAALASLRTFRGATAPRAHTRSEARRIAVAYSQAERKRRFSGGSPAQQVTPELQSVRANRRRVVARPGCADKRRSHPALGLPRLRLAATLWAFLVETRSLKDLFRGSLGATIGAHAPSIRAHDAMRGTVRKRPADSTNGDRPVQRPSRLAPPGGMLFT